MIRPEQIAQLAEPERLRLKILLDEIAGREAQRLYYRIFPQDDTLWNGPSILGGLVEPGQTLHARRKYAKHMDFFRLGAKYRERCFMAANRVGKTLSGGGYELSAHLTGDYPDWWEGRRFEYPIAAWAAGVTYATTRDILQLTLLGKTVLGRRKTVDGRGIIPGERLGPMSWNRHVDDLINEISVQHVHGGYSTLQFKSYQGTREVFQGTGKHVVLLDEEPPADIYAEALMRIATLDGLMMLTFTPLKGMSEVVQSFLSPEEEKKKRS